MKLDDFKLLIEAGNPIIAMETPDETRAVRLVREVADAGRLPLVQWSATEGLRMTPPEGDRTLVDPGKLVAALGQVRQSSYPVLYVFKDVGPAVQGPAGGPLAARPLFFARLAVVDRDSRRGDGPAARRAAADRAVRHRLARRGRADGMVRRTFQEVQNRSLRPVESKLTRAEWKCWCRPSAG